MPELKVEKIQSSKLDFIYMEPYKEDNNPIFHKRFGEFLIKYSIPKIAYGILDPIRDDPEGILYGINKKSCIFAFFNAINGSNIKVFAHPCDNFNDKYPMNYNGFQKLEALVHYMKDLNKFISDNGITNNLSGIAVGEGLGTAEFVMDCRKKAAETGLGNIEVAMAVGGPEIGLDVALKQVYDWSHYPNDANPWIQLADKPEEFF